MIGQLESPDRDHQPGVVNNHTLTPVDTNKRKQRLALGRPTSHCVSDTPGLLRSLGRFQFGWNWPLQPLSLQLSLLLFHPSCSDPAQPQPFFHILFSQFPFTAALLIY
jgi:hypothetical protein